MSLRHCTGLFVDIVSCPDFSRRFCEVAKTCGIESSVAVINQQVCFVGKEDFPVLVSVLFKVLSVLLYFACALCQQYDVLFPKCNSSVEKQVFQVACEVTCW